MAQQVKISNDVKREIELYAAITGKTQGEILAASWQEYKALHQDEFKKGLEWASCVLESAGATAVHASGMSVADLSEIDSALNG